MSSFRASSSQQAGTMLAGHPQRHRQGWGSNSSHCCAGLRHVMPSRRLLVARTSSQGDANLDNTASSSSSSSSSSRGDNDASIQGAVLAVAPSQCLALSFSAQPSTLQATAARLMGVALLYRGLLAQALQRACRRGRLHATSSQRLMLGCIVPASLAYLALKAVISQWGISCCYTPLALLPAVLAAELATHLLAFQVYHPGIIAKLLLPVAATLLLHALMPPMPSLAGVLPAAPRGCTPVTAGAAVLLSKRGLGWLGRAVSKAGPIAARGITKYYRKKLVKTAFSKVLAAAPLPKPKGPSTPPLATTAVQLMDFMLPSCAVAWGYWFIMLQHVATMLNAYMPELLFVGEATLLSSLLKQLWSAGFLAGAFAADALKTAADRDHLALEENRHINLSLAFLEAGYAACLGFGMLQGSVAVKPYSCWRLATACAALLFCLRVWWASQHKAEQKGYPVIPTVSSMDWQQATEQKREYHVATTAALVALNIITSCV
ncbi:hypothetical protein OEZ85_009911 [Tetradesmus obliquus]|uniref:Uncharacterized protein n=1 Tax=Tetradesmus obliquus TaxID=3088 RepID=A0ABY8UFK6_TETOB|nr:hypothetical protein OEZ85_009911 [Tetradesmus obliquus]